MEIGNILNEYRLISNEEGEITPEVFLGNYMAFPGVRYYVLLDEQDVAEDRNRVGAVGWRLPNTTTIEQAQSSGRIPVAV